MSRTPISDYAMLSDCRTAALVSRDGSVDWLCMPRFDSPAVFARLLDLEAGHWSIRPAGDGDSTREYADGSLVLDTTWRTSTGTAVVRDALAMGPDDRGHDLGSASPHTLLRQIRGREGRVEFDVEWAPRAEYGLVRPLITRDSAGLTAHGGAAMLRLSSGARWEVDGSAARARIAVERGETVEFALQFGWSWEDAPAAWTAAQIRDRLGETVAAWRSWSEMHQSYKGPYADHVHASGRVLQGLTFFPTGAMVAAPTTSLPEVVGGGRNWDYRFCWVRDASFTLQALWVAACPDESRKFFQFMSQAAHSGIADGDGLQIVFGVGGEHDLSERELAHLSGWRDSRPVRIGNGAWTQRQLDVYGELLGAVHQLRDQLPDPDPVLRSFLVSLADKAAECWRQKDHGIWEMRGEPRHFLYSKLMCWVALDRALDLADLLDARHRTGDWEREREQIRDAILTEGWSDQANAFAQSFGSDALDASSLVIPLVGFLPPDDGRVIATIRSIEAELTDSRGLLHRYLGDDGLEGSEGSFLLCTFWLAQAKALAGDPLGGREIVDRTLGFCNDVGLFSEEVETSSGALIGNFPQAFSHVGLINAAWAISQAEGRGSSGGPTGEATIP